MALRGDDLTGTLNPLDSLLVRGIWRPVSVVAQKRVGEDNQLSHDRSDGGFCGFPAGNQLLVLFPEWRIVARGDKGGHVERLSQTCPLALDVRVPLPFI